MHANSLIVWNMFSLVLCTNVFLFALLFLNSHSMYLRCDWHSHNHVTKCGLVCLKKKLVFTYINDFLTLHCLSLQADDVRALLTAAMPPSALPACYKPQVISVSASVAVVPSTLNSSQTPLSSNSSMDGQSGTFPELSTLLQPSGAEGAVGIEMKEEGGFIQDYCSFACSKHLMTAERFL